jgi:type II secretory pathway pseudopilin PulG
MFIQNILAKLADGEANTPQLFSAVYSKRYIMKKVASRCPLNASTGRSMVEMLGVLAIIGVLSVGAIAGYSKAMMKYKLNKQTEQIGSILDYVNMHLDDFKRSKTTTAGYLIPILTKLDVIPKEMIRGNRDDAIFDVFGTTISLSNYTVGDGDYYFEFILYINKGQKESCMNLFNIAKAKREQLWRTKFETIKGDESSSDNSAWGDAYCYAGAKCLKDLTVAEMENYCNVCEDKDSCAFYYQMMF